MMHYRIVVVTACLGVFGLAGPPAFILTPKPMCKFADLNCDGSVGVADLLILLEWWGACAPEGDCPADRTGDGSVGVADLLMLLGAWG